MTPFELAARHLVPPLRALTARRLLERGMSQNEVAGRLGVTQPMVRKYATSADDAMEKLIGAGLPREAVEAMAGAIADAASRGYWEHVSAMNSIIVSVLSGGSLCAFHRRLDHRVPRDCSLCGDSLKGGSDQYIEDAANALSALEGDPDAYLLVPEVGMNVAVAPPGASTVEQVVGIPGRIVRVGTRIAALGRPSYGGSTHTAGVALWAGRRWGFPRAAVAVRYSDDLLRAAASIGMRSVAMGEDAPHQPDVVVDGGGRGVEPILYFLGRSASEAIGRALEAARRVKRRRPRRSLRAGLHRLYGRSPHRGI